MIGQLLKFSKWGGEMTKFWNFVNFTFKFWTKNTIGWLRILIFIVIFTGKSIITHKS